MFTTLPSTHPNEVNILTVTLSRKVTAAVVSCKGFSAEPELSTGEPTFCLPPFSNFIFYLVLSFQLDMLVLPKFSSTLFIHKPGAGCLDAKKADPARKCYHVFRLFGRRNAASAVALMVRASLATFAKLEVPMSDKNRIGQNSYFFQTQQPDERCSFTDIR